MLQNSFSGSLGLLTAGLLITGCADQPSTALSPEDALQPTLSSAAQLSSVGVNWHAQQAGFGRTGAVAGAAARLVRNANGISFQLNTNSLTPGNAFTLWLVVIDNPGACATTPCAAPDIIGNEDADAQVRFAAGHVAGGSGAGTFAGAVRLGPLLGWLPDRAFDNVMGAEVHLVINDHGPQLPEFMPGMIHTYRGGCSDASPFPPVFPATALADGAVGPNLCRLYQVAVFPAP